MLPLCREEGVGVIPWSPLARGFLAGNRKGGEARTKRAGSDPFADRLYHTEEDYQVAGRAAEVADRLGVTPAQVATAWLLAQPGVTAPIIGASKMPHLEQAVDALKIQLAPGDLRALEELYQPHPVLGI